MPLVTVAGLAKSFRMQPLFEDVSFTLEPGEKLGVIGLNGSGKSTLLRIVAGIESPDAGELSMARDTTLSFLPQNPFFPEGVTVLESIFASQTETMALLRRYEAACEALHADPGMMDRVARLADELEAAGAWSLEVEARNIMTGLGITDMDRPVAELSGGQRKLVALAHALVGRPGLLLLDEPTNHLDTERIRWLEDYLARSTGALLMVTHDRYFLERVTRRILEVADGTVTSYAGSYSYYLEKKDEQEARKAHAAARRKSLLKRELEWLRRGPRGRATRQKARFDRAQELLSKAPETAERELEIQTGSRRLGNKVVELRGLGKSFEGKAVVENLDFVLEKGERVGLLGPNGAGKSTLLDLVAGRLAPDLGEVVLGPTVAIGYYDQESRELDETQKVIDYVREGGEVIRTGSGRELTAAQMLEQFLFPGTAQHTAIARLSGGERRRLYLLRVLMGSPNVLLLDEPTNDLDIDTLIRLEAYLDQFPGSLLVASHDRYFLDRTVGRLLLFRGRGRVDQALGGYSENVDLAPLPEERVRPAPVGPLPPAPKSRKLRYKEQRELETLERSIEEAETRKKDLEHLLAGVGFDHQKAEEFYRELQQLDRNLEDWIERWSELEELRSSG
ncbi:MAG: ABC-F family ATP-binding cassette domain-containing protein [Armatimonadetes bacterium]|nr:ABC-F family ATP-binding cassette domain-containing protein [Armatimonadota bacterium]